MQVFSFRLWALAVVAAAWELCASACTEPQRLAWRLQFEPEALAERARSIEAEVLKGGCTGRPLFSTRLLPDEQSPSPGELPPGHYGFRARARDAGCRWFAEGCEEVVLPRHGLVEVVLRERSGLGRDPACIAEDATGSDGGATWDADATAPVDARAGGLDAFTEPSDDAGGAADPPPDKGMEMPDATPEVDLDAAWDAEVDSAPDAIFEAGTDTSGTEPPVFDPAAPKCRELDDAVVACFDFDGTLADLSGHGNDARGQDVTFEPALSGSALRVGGKRVAVNDAANLNLGAFTIELWVRSDGLPNLSGEDDGRSILVDKNEQYLVGHEPSGALRMQLYRNPNNASSFSADPSSPLTPGVFTYLAYTYDGARAAAYRDGARVDADQLNVELSRGNGGPLQIGSGNPSQTRAFNGLIDALRISDVARAQDAICGAAGKRSAGAGCQ